MAKKEKSMITRLGPWAFLLGFVIALIAAIIAKQPTTGTLWVLGILGLIVGLLNISDEEVRTYLTASIAFLVSASSLAAIFQPVPLIGPAITPFLTNVIVFIAPGTAVVALKALYMISKD